MKDFYRLSAIGVLLLCPLVTRPAGAQLVPLGPETAVVSDHELALECPQVIGHADRSFTVVWSRALEPTAQSIMAQRFDGTGAPVGALIDVDAGGALTGRYLFDVKAENRGALGDIVTWSSFVVDTAGSHWRFDSRLLAAAASARVATPSYVRQLFPRSVGGYLGVWPVTNGCSFALLDASGRITSPTTKISGADPETRCVEAAQARDGSFALDWYRPIPLGTNRSRRFGATAKPLGPESGPADGIAGEVQLASAPDGRTALAWIDFVPNPGGVKGPLRAQFFAADGRPASPAATLDTPTPPVTGGTSFGPDAVAMDRLGRALIVWDFQTADQAPNPAPSRFNLQLRTPAGAASPVLDLGASPVQTGGALFCASAAAAGRTWVVVWRARLANGDLAIFVRRFFS
ncbi:MAG TPA: hypothetical protein VGH73_11020 [Thermoanaerobaculia bacterium]